MQFPRLVFRSPGPDQCQGGTYAHALVCDEAQFAAFVANGWSETLPEALKPPPAIVAQAGDIIAHADHVAPVLPPVVVLLTDDAPADDTPATRDEMKEQAAKLGLVHPFNVTNKKLAEMIDFAMAPKG